MNNKDNNAQPENGVKNPIKNQRATMALSPLMAIAGIFLHPMASTVMPLILFFMFKSRRPMAADTALKTADLAFSMQLWLILISLFLRLGLSMSMITVAEARYMTELAVYIILAYFVVSLSTAIIYATRGKTYKYLISFRIAERVLGNLEKKADAKLQEDNQDRK